MSRNKVILGSIVVFCVFFGMGTFTLLLALGYFEPSPNETSVMLYTYGDSLTDCGTFGMVVRSDDVSVNNYQRHLYHYLRVRGVVSKIYNLGIGGQLTHEIIGRYFEAGAPNNSIIMAGTNNIYGLPQEGLSNATHVFETIAVHYRMVLETGKNVFVCSVPPLALHVDRGQCAVIVRVNEMLRALVAQYPATATYCDVHTHLGGIHYLQNIHLADGIHLNMYGNEVLGQAIGECVFNKVL